MADGAPSCLSATYTAFTKKTNANNDREELKNKQSVDQVKINLENKQRLGRV
jgi:hypothetical protein